MLMFAGELLFYLFMEVLLYSLGRFVIPIISLGRARAVRVKEIINQGFGQDRPAYDEDGKMLVPEWAAMIIGVVTLFGLVALLVALHQV
jgi:hypothetical protein